MSSNLEIECPKCGEHFELTEALAAPLLDAERKKVDTEVVRRVQAERAAIAKQAAAEAGVELGAKLQASQAALAERDAKLRQAQEVELTLRRDREALEQAQREMELTVQRRVDEEKAIAAKQAVADVERDFEAKLSAAQASIASMDAKLEVAQKSELALRRDREALEQAKREMELTVQRRVDEEKANAAKQAVAEVQRDFETKLSAAQASIAAKDAKLEVAAQAELHALQAKQEAEEAMRQAELTVARRLDEERAKVREQAVHERDEEYRLKIGDKDKQLMDLRLQIEDLRRKGDSTSQQLVGDVQELDLFDVLRATFPGDDIQRVKKGQNGADILHIVCNRLGQPCGKILWESKRTKNWSDGWLGKLREDQRAEKADLAALMTETLPDGVQHFDTIENIWVTGVRTVVPVAKALREAIVETANARRAAAGAGTTKDLMYGYLTGTEFRQRVRGAIDPIIEMQSDLDSERRAITKRWSAREKQLNRVMHSMAGMYGDLQGIAGSSLPDVEGLALLGVDEPEKEPKLSVVNSDLMAVAGYENGQE